MSAGNNWKRPRERDATEVVENSQCATRDDIRLSAILQSPLYTGPTLGEQSEMQSRRQSSSHVAPVVPPAIASPSPHRRVGFLDKTVQDGSNWTLPNPMLHHPKRPRLGDYTATDSHSIGPPLSSVQGEAQPYGRDGMSTLLAGHDKIARSLQGRYQTPIVLQKLSTKQTKLSGRGLDGHRVVAKSQTEMESNRKRLLYAKIHSEGR